MNLVENIQLNISLRRRGTLTGSKSFAVMYR